MTQMMMQVGTLLLLLRGNGLTGGGASDEVILNVSGSIIQN